MAEKETSEARRARYLAKKRAHGDRWISPQGEVSDRMLKRDATLRALARKGELPLEYMLRVMRDPQAPTERRDNMATCAAPYLHARLASVEVKAEHTIRKVAREPMTREEWEKKYSIPPVHSHDIVTNGNGSTH